MEANADAIVVAFQSAEVLGICIAALRSDPAVSKIIVVNNSAGDESRIVATAYPNVVYREPGRNVGFGTAVNLGLAEVEQEFVVLANPDAFADPGTTGELVRFLQDHPQAAIAAPRMRSPDGSVYRNSQYRLSLMRMAFQALGWPELLQVKRSRGRHRKPHKTNYVIGSFIVCRVAACDSVRWFDESIFLFGEDQDFCRRLATAGWEIWYTGLGEVVHRSGHSWRQLSDSAQTSFRQARYRELKADTGPLQAMLYRMAVGFSSARSRSK